MQCPVNDAVYHRLSEEAAERCISICFLTWVLFVKSDLNSGWNWI